MWCKSTKRKYKKTALFPGGPTGFILAKVAFAECEPRCLRCCALLALGQREGRPLSEDVRQDGDDDGGVDYGNGVDQNNNHDYHPGDYPS